MTATPNDADQRRAARRRHLQQRQTLVFGGLITVLAVVGLVSTAMWTGLLPAPFAREFSTAEPSDANLAIPCVPADATPVAFSEITANVYNGTDRNGLAASSADSLTQVGVVVNQQANWPQGAYSGVVQVVVGPLGVTSGYTVARLFPSAVVSLDTSRTDETVDVVLGATYEAMLSADEIAALDPAAPLASPEGCTPVDAPAGDGAAA
ncbi:LytR C-terminal domain-containing protein [Georgenia sp. SYP-B2076]|uniref:LytR C-terminal domain-containing protein n=1 Tax=Georgenia sp. SYP-B2076 TaxID=2495881 RepID=UPI000F8D2EDF|nr:LytR C-terminal domain-containing protein [Georgenia sp. SYP-B2076]